MAFCHTLAIILGFLAAVTQAERPSAVDGMVEQTSDGHMKLHNRKARKSRATTDESKLQVSRNATDYPPDVSFSGTCPGNWVTNHDGPNDAVINFINKCLHIIHPDHIDNKLKEILAGGCTGAFTNPDTGRVSDGKVVTVKNGSQSAMRINLKTPGSGGVCAAKLYTGNCAGGEFVHPECEETPLYRVFNNGARTYSDYWVAANPMEHWASKDEFRDSVAICRNWNNMDNVAEYVLNKRSCNLVFVIGNGERVSNCADPINDAYEYSTTLQIGVCPYQPAAMTEQGHEAWP